MKLYGSPTSPYVRKARVVIHEKKVPCEWVAEDPWAEDSPISRRNPFGKVPALEIEPNNYLFDSMLIVHYLDHVDGKSLTPKDAAGYWQAQWWQALAHGMIDATVARVLETRRPEDKQMPAKIAREEARIHRAIAVAEQRFHGDAYVVAKRLSLADLMLGVALQYIDFRYAHDWRSEAPKLASWHGSITTRRCFQETLPPGFQSPAD